MRKRFEQYLANQINQLKQDGLYKEERIIATSQQAAIKLGDGKEVINFCANNYLGLANHPELIQKAKEAVDQYGYGVASVRFICGTQTVHKQLEQRVSSFLKTEDAILYSSCFDANTGLFETILGPEDAIISDSLNHASIIDGVRLCKAKRLRYNNNDMIDLEAKLKDASDCRFKLIATDGVFSMDGIIANLKGVCDLADQYGAMVMVDDSHAVGFMGENGRGTPEYCGVMDRVDIFTGTFGKALGGASGGYTAGKKEVVEWLRQRSRPYLFSNSLAPAIAATSIAVIDLLEKQTVLRRKLHQNAEYWRCGLEKIGFEIIPGQHPIVPVMIGQARLAQQMANELLNENIYVVGFSFPVVPKETARIRTQMSAGHTKEHLDRALEGFRKVGSKLNII
ncbi:MAG: glycine C-acetyltransferase [Desulfobacteraceae bacterium]|nr:glycine C-acetyltransferase [Desulfobacteraceae bacterium]